MEIERGLIKAEPLPKNDIRHGGSEYIRFTDTMNKHDLR